MTAASPKFEYLLRLGDSALVNGQRLSEWCGHGPFLEEDIGAANTALDLIGRARMLLTYAGEVEGKGRSEDDLAYGRDERGWRNFVITELPNRDFGFSTVRQFFLDVYDLHLYEALRASRDERLSAIAAKTHKECVYHERHTREWMLRLGDGTEESHRRVQQAVNELWPFTGELFQADAIDRQMQDEGIAPDLHALGNTWLHSIAATLKEATLKQPQAPVRTLGGRSGVHSEHMGFLLAELQFLQRAYPEMQW